MSRAAAAFLVEAIAEQVGVPQQTVSDWLKDFTEIGKLSESGQIAATFQGFEARIYNVWKFKNKSSGQTGHAGNSEQGIVENLLHAYTEPFDVVLDPFAGGA